MTETASNSDNGQLATFRADLSRFDSRQVFRKYVLDGAPNVLDANTSFGLRETICDHFDIEFTDVIIVGSSKLGFSIKPTRRYGLFNDDSDIDVAVVSSRLFERVWREATLYSKSGADWPKKSTFFQYLASKGWVRPDKLPPSRYFDFSKQWWQFFREISTQGSFGPYKVKAGIYQSWFFLEEYQKVCIEQCIREARDEYLGNK